MSLPHQDGHQETPQETPQETSRSPEHPSPAPHVAAGEAAPSAPGYAAPFPWQRVSSLAGLPPLDMPLERQPGRASHASLPEPFHAAPTVPQLAALPERATTTGVAAIDRAHVARLDRRAFAIVVACVLLLLLGAAAPFALAQYAANPGAAPRAQTGPAQISTPVPTAPPAPTMAPTLAPTVPPTPQPTQVPAVAPAPTTAPTPKPTATQPPRPAPMPPPAIIASGALAAPARLALACGAPTSLALHNTSGATIEWSVVPPSGVLVNGWSGRVRGTLAPRGTLALAVTERPGVRGGTTHLVFTSQGQSLAVTLALASC